MLYFIESYPDISNFLQSNNLNCIENFPLFFYPQSWFLQSKNNLSIDLFALNSSGFSYFKKYLKNNNISNREVPLINNNNYKIEDDLYFNLSKKIKNLDIYKKDFEIYDLITKNNGYLKL